MHIITVVKENYIEDIEKALNQRKKPIELLNIILVFLNFKSVEIRIYNLLLKTSLTIRQLEQQLNISERTIRKYIKRLDEEGFIIKKVEQGKRLKYVYMAVPIQETWEKVKDKMEKILGDITKVLEAKTMFF
jgi:predicted transcriptional regulator